MHHMSDRPWMGPATAPSHEATTIATGQTEGVWRGWDEAGCIDCARPSIPTIPPIADAILCAWIMHAVSKIQISHFTSSFSCTRARPPRRAARSASGKSKEKCCWRCSSRVQAANRCHKAKRPTLDLAATFRSATRTTAAPAAFSLFFPLALLAALRGGRARVHEKEELTDD